MRVRMSATLSTLLATCALAACSGAEGPQNAAINEDLNTDTIATAQTEGANSFTESQARGHVENAGFTNVSPMTRTDSGLWQGAATRGGETVNVSVDYRGAVAITTASAAPPTTVAQANAAADAGSDAATISDDPAAVPGATSPQMRQTGERG